MTLSGILGRKIGMTQLYRDDGRLEAATVIEAGPSVVTQVKTSERDGYAAVQVGFGEAKRLTAPERGHLGYGGLNRTRRAGRSEQRPQGSQLGLLRYLREFPLPEEGASVGDRYDIGIFTPGQLVDISGRSKGKGFAGGVRRHGFHGGPKTHGQSDRHRAPGSIGATTTPGRVVKGLRMAGHMGDHEVTVQHLEVLQIDPERNLLFVRGAVPSVKGRDQFKAEVYVLTKEEGGRHTPFFPGYKPQFYIRTTDVTGSITLPQGVEMVMPGDNVNLDVGLIYPVAIEEGLRFAIREGGHTVGAGVITAAS